MRAVLTLHISCIVCDWNYHFQWTVFDCFWLWSHSIPSLPISWWVIDDNCIPESSDLISVVGCALSLHMPFASALTAVNGVQTEIGSAVFCYTCVYPTRFWSTLYVLVMVTSNTVGMYWGWVVLDSPGVPLLWGGTYFALALMLCVMRTISILGFFQYPDPMSHLKLKDNWIRVWSANEMFWSDFVRLFFIFRIYFSNCVCLKRYLESLFCNSFSKLHCIAIKWTLHRATSCFCQNMYFRYPVIFWTWNRFSRHFIFSRALLVVLGT